jgi:ubiquinone/menaquinone biosynthesis C-methylase UbiE
MLAHSRVVAPDALFLVGRAESLPFSAGAFDLIAAAGALNYVDVDLFLPDAVRVTWSDTRLATCCSPRTSPT